MVVFATYANEDDYKEIQGSHAFKTLDEHWEAIRAAKLVAEARGETVELVECDKDGYYAFLVLNETINSPQSVAAYVSLKLEGLEKVPHPELKHQNITIDRRTK